MNKQLKTIGIIPGIVILALAFVSCGNQASSAEESEAGLQTADLTGEARACVECHAIETAGIAAGWDMSRHADEAVSCIDCHQTDPDSPMAFSGVEGHDYVEVAVSMLVPPSVCAECHEDQVAQFNASGHYRAGLQVLAKDSMSTLMYVQEGRNNPELSRAPNETGCGQCHGMPIEVDESGHPLDSFYPSSGVGNIYPNGEVGNCTVCHTRHTFRISEARRPEACASCHLGPDHPDIEIYEASKHGQIYHTEGEEWVWDSAPGEWEPGDYTAPTCATCHMSGIGDLSTTHNVTQRLYWNLWAKVSRPRNDPDVMATYYGDAEAGRAEMEQVCSECHSETLYSGFFASADRAIRLYNEEYFAPAEEMRADLEARGLLGDNPWQDEFQTVYYFLWHHEGRRARQGAIMGGADWAHWHGFFDLMQDIYRLEQIYEQRIETGEIE